MEAVVICTILLLMMNSGFTMSSKHELLSRSGLKVISDTITEGEDIPARIIIRSRRQAILASNAALHDRTEADKIRHLIDGSREHTRVPRESKEGMTDVLRRLDQSVEDKWKLKQGALGNLLTKRSDIYGRKSLTLASALRGARDLTTSQSTQLQGSSARVDDPAAHQALAVPLSIIPYERTNDFIE